MATTKSSSKSKTSKFRALQMLKEDHETVDGYFEKYERANDAKKTEWIARICAALRGREEIPCGVGTAANDDRFVGWPHRLFPLSRLGHPPRARRSRSFRRSRGISSRPLSVHAQVEEEIFYPALREVLGEDGQANLDEANVEHEHVKTLVEQLESAEGGDEFVDARMKVLSEYVRHHVKEEEKQMFPMVKKADGLDFVELAERMDQRKSELKSDAVAQKR